MTTAENAAFVGDIPHYYDFHLGPNFFEQYGEDIARRAGALRPIRVLELAAGTGIVSRKLRDHLPDDTQLVITDLNEPMLEIARQKFQPYSQVKFQVVDAMDTGFADASFDLIVSQFGVMFFPDKVTSFREAKRILKPGGSYLFNAWSGLDANPRAKIANTLAEETFPEDPPGFYKVPFHYADPEVVTADLTEAGFSQVTHETLPLTNQVESYDFLSKGLVYGNPLAEELRQRGADPEVFRQALIDRLRTAYGPEPATMALEASVYHARA